MGLLGTSDKLRWMGEETSPPSNSSWLKYVSVAQEGGFVKYAIFGHGMSHLSPIKAPGCDARTYKAPIANQVGRL